MTPTVNQWRRPRYILCECYFVWSDFTRSNWWCCLVGQKRRHFGNDSNLSMLNNEKVKQAADNIMILDYNQYVNKYLSMYVCALRCWHSLTVRFFCFTVLLRFLMPFLFNLYPKYPKVPFGYFWSLQSWNFVDVTILQNWAGTVSVILSNSVPIYLSICLCLSTEFSPLQTASSCRTTAWRLALPIYTAVHFTTVQ